MNVMTRNTRKGLMATAALLLTLTLVGCGGSGGNGDGGDLIAVTSLTVEGTVSDNLSPMPSISVAGLQVSVDATAFSTTVETVSRQCFEVSGWDQSNNARTLVVEIR